ncbi:MAG: glycosyltransferase family 2 protein [Gaiellaceae bacterium]
MSEGTEIDLVVPTFGRTAEVERFLESVAAQTWRGPTRVILVDQNADDRLAPIVEANSDRLALLRVRSEPGTSRACNVGFRHCTAGIIGRPDDDCWYPSHALDQVVEVFQAHPDWDAACGITCDESGRPTQLRWDATGGIVTRENVFQRAIGSTLFMRRSLFEAVGDWDESYGPRPDSDGTIRGGSEDGEYILRIVARGFTLGYEPAIRIFHAEFGPPVRDRASMRKAYYYGVDHSRLLRQYGFPPRYALWRAAQLFAAFGFFLVRGHAGRARFYLAMARGRLAGMFLRSRP